MRDETVISNDGDKTALREIRRYIRVTQTVWIRECPIARSEGSTIDEKEYGSLGAVGLGKWEIKVELK